MDREAARDVFSVLYMYGEHFAGRAPMEPLDREAELRLGRVLRDLNIALGGTGRIA
jgi:hypothetical protein